MILKGKCLTHSASDIRRKLQNLIQEPGVSLDEMLTTANAVFYSQDQERQARAQEEKRKGTRHAQILVTLVGQSQPYSTGPSRSTLKDTKCHVHLKVGHWAKECPNHNKPPQVPCCKNKKAGHWAELSVP